MRSTLVLLLFFLPHLLPAQNHSDGEAFADSSYDSMKASIVKKFRLALPGKFGAFVKGVDEDIKTEKNILALTFDACGGPTGDGFSGLWIDCQQRKIYRAEQGYVV